MKPDDDRLRDVFNTVEPYIEERYGIPVVISDVPNPFTGDLDGAEIRVDYAIDIEEAVFVVIHLFGHTVQWNTDASARELGLEQPVRPSEDWLRRLRAYELEACGYSLRLFHDLAITDLDAWVSDFAACDLAYLEHFYRTGDKLEFRSFWRDDQPLIVPVEIPPFQPKRWVSRWEGIVV